MYVFIIKIITMRFTANKLQEQKKVDNHQGVMASYSLEPEQELVKLALTSFVDKTFYEGMDDKITRIRECISKCDSDFVIKLALWARDKGLRTVNQILLIESIKHPDFVRYFNEFVKRPDEIIDILGYYAMVNKQNPNALVLANKLKKAIKAKMESFKDYHLAKYKGKGDVINLFDIVNMSHAFSEPIDKMMKGTLPKAQTWETELSANGNTKESWDKLLAENSLGALAFVRNLRNMMNAKVSETTLLEYMSGLDFDKVFPYQLILAVDVAANESWFGYNSKLFSALQNKIASSFEKYKRLFRGKVAVAVDDSGSMCSALNSKSSLRMDRLAMYYGVAIAEMWADLYTWNTTMKKIALDNFSFANFRADGGGTNVNCVINGLRGRGYDTLFIITDEQSQFSMSSSDIDNIIVWNLADYKHSLLPSFDKGYTYITGFNDAQFELIEDLRDIKGLVNAIKSLEI